MRKIWVDTDIGVDPDDIFALYLLFKSGKVDLQWISVTFQNLSDKLAIVRHITKKMDKPNCEILRGNLPPEVRGQTHGFLTEQPLIETCEIEDTQAQTFCPALEPKVLPKNFELVTIGPLTTAVAVATKFKPTRIISMLANLEKAPNDREYNLRSDVTAFNNLSKLGIPHFVLSREEYQKCPFDKEELKEAVSKSSIVKILQSSVEIYQAFVHEKFGVDKNLVWLADVIAIMFLIDPDLFEINHGEFMADQYGVSWFEPNSNVQGGALLVKNPENLVSLVYKFLNG